LVEGEGLRCHAGNVTPLLYNKTVYKCLDHHSRQVEMVNPYLRYADHFKAVI
jgi:hypothetical protein